MSYGKLLNCLRKYIAIILSKLLNEKNPNNDRYSILSLGYKPGKQKTALLSATPIVHKFSDEDIKYHHPFGKMLMMILT